MILTRTCSCCGEKRLEAGGKQRGKRWYCRFCAQPASHVFGTPGAYTVKVTGDAGTSERVLTITDSSAAAKP